MFCINCGKELPDDAKFCSGCRKQIEAKKEEIINTVPVCSSCGEELKPGNKFCIKCGTPVNTQYVLNNQPPVETFGSVINEISVGNHEKPDVGSLSMEQIAKNYNPVTPKQTVPPPQPTKTEQIKILKALRVLSIIGMVWFSVLFLLPFLSGTEFSVEEAQGIGIFIIGYAIAHAIVVLVNGIRHKIGVIKVMAIISLIWCFWVFIFPFYRLETDAWGAELGLPVFGLGVYALVLSIVSFVKSKFIQLQSNTETSKGKNLKVLRILSIIGFIWFSLTLISHLSFTVFIFSYAFTHAIVALEQGNKYKIGAIKVMAIIGIILYALSSFIFIVRMLNSGELELGMLKSGMLYDDFMSDYPEVVLGLSYALAFSIITFVKSKKIGG